MNFVSFRAPDKETTSTHFVQFRNTKARRTKRYILYRFVRLKKTYQYAFRSVQTYKGQAHETLHFVSFRAPEKTYQRAFRSVQIYKGQAHETIHFVSLRTSVALVVLVVVVLNDN